MLFYGKCAFFRIISRGSHAVERAPRPRATPLARSSAFTRKDIREPDTPGSGRDFGTKTAISGMVHFGSNAPADDGRARESIMARVGSNVGKKKWRKVVFTLVTVVAVAGSFIFWKRYDIAVRYMEGNKKAQEIIILQMLEIARPIIERDFKMTFPEKLLSTLTGHRNEKERQTDALKDVRIFCEQCFRNHWLKFEDVHRLGSLDGFDLRGFDFALIWKREKPADVLTAFEVNFLKRVIDRMQLNQNCLFFSALRLYVENKAKVN
jgi:hypothetical protein